MTALHHESLHKNWAAVALAHENARSAWALLAHNQEYRVRPSYKLAEHRPCFKTFLDNARGIPGLMTRSVRPASPDADVLKGRDGRQVDQEEKGTFHRGPKVRRCLDDDAG